MVSVVVGAYCRRLWVLHVGIRTGALGGPQHRTYRRLGVVLVVLWLWLLLW